VDYSSRAAAVTVDLDGEAGDDGEPGEGDTVSATTEDVFGGAGADTLTGNDADNTLRGGPGGDNFTGGPGTDLADYSDHTAGVTVDLADTAADQGAAGEGDTLAEMENIVSGKGSDVLSGNAARNWIDGGAGADEISGRGGFDTLDYSSHRDRVVVVVDGQANDGSRNEHDNVGVDIEQIIGTRGNDVILTGSGRQVIDGRGGDDILDGWFGSDVYKGGNGFDYVAYFGRTKAVHADLDGHADDGESGENDVLSSDVESLAGGNANDVLVGNRRTNGLAGGRGNDTITGGAGSDGLFGDAGSDKLFARDGRRDFVVGGKGSDHAFIDAGLDVVRSVEALARVITLRAPAWSGRPFTWGERLQFIVARRRGANPVLLQASRWGRDRETHCPLCPRDEPLDTGAEEEDVLSSSREQKTYPETQAVTLLLVHVFHRDCGDACAQRLQQRRGQSLFGRGGGAKERAPAGRILSDR
jgi:RTX calcium-binding nonapeptide repeat (4 copies)